jgi:hypothetical protein
MLIKRHYSTSKLQTKDLISNDILSKLDQKSEFLNWFSGFTDAEAHIGIINFR